MKFEYEKPELEELELLLEGSFFCADTTPGGDEGVDIEPGEGDNFE